MSEPGYEILSIDGLDRASRASGEPVVMPLGRRLGFRPFAVDCLTADGAGGHLIDRHDERGGAEELYVVVRGRALFTVEDREIDAPARTLVYAPPGTMRDAIATEKGTIVLAAGAERSTKPLKSSSAHIDELDAIELPDGFVWRPVRRHFGIRAFGVNAYTAREAGGPIVEEHTESRLGHEEIYLVLRGRALFTVDGNEHELVAGQLVFVRDPSLARGAIALDGETAVLALGGKPGEPHTVSAWEAMFAAVPAAQEERWDEAIAIHEEALVEQPEHPALLYNLACMEARAGRHLDALLRLKRAVALEPQWGEHAREDSDFAAIRHEPGFPA